MCLLHPEIFHCIEIFLSFRILSNLRLPWKQDLHWIHCIEYIFLSFRIFEQLALALKTGFALNSLYWNMFIIQDFWATCACPENRVCPEFTVLKYFYHLGFLSNLRLPLKTRVALISFTVLKYFCHSGFLSNLRLPGKSRVALKCFIALKYFYH